MSDSDSEIITIKLPTINITSIPLPKIDNTNPFINQKPNEILSNGVNKPFHVIWGNTNTNPNMNTKLVPPAPILRDTHITFGNTSGSIGSSTREHPYPPQLHEIEHEESNNNSNTVGTCSYMVRIKYASIDSSSGTTIKSDGWCYFESFKECAMILGISLNRLSYFYKHTQIINGIKAGKTTTRKGITVDIFDIQRCKSQKYKNLLEGFIMASQLFGKTREEAIQLLNDKVYK